MILPEERQIPENSPSVGRNDPDRWLWLLNKVQASVLSPFIAEK